MARRASAGAEVAWAAGDGPRPRAGIVFVWTEGAELAHAAVHLGDGWMLSKPSHPGRARDWCERVRDTVNAWRLQGTRLSRRKMAY